MSQTYLLACHESELLEFAVPSIAALKKQELHISVSLTTEYIIMLDSDSVIDNCPRASFAARIIIDYYNSLPSDEIIF